MTCVVTISRPGETPFNKQLPSLTFCGHWGWLEESDAQRQLTLKQDAKHKRDRENHSNLALAGEGGQPFKERRHILGERTVWESRG
jgi:hypothetical protein